MTTSMSPSSSRSPKAAPRAGRGRRGRRPEALGHVHEPAGAEIAVDDLALRIGRFRLQLVHLGIDVAVGEEDVEPAVVVEVDEPGAPAEPPRVEAEAAGERPVLAEAVPEVGVQRRRVAGEVGLDDVEGAVAIVVADADAHARLRLAVLAVGAAGADADVGERAVVVVAIERARVRIVRDVDVGPAVVVEVERADAEAVGAAGLGDAGAGRRRPRRCRRPCCGTARWRRRAARADRTRPGCPCSGRGPNRASAPWRDRGRCSWRRTDRAARRGRSRGRRRPVPHRVPAVARPARAVTSVNVPSPVVAKQPVLAVEGDEQVAVAVVVVVGRGRRPGPSR